MEVNGILIYCNFGKNCKNWVLKMPGFAPHKIAKTKTQPPHCTRRMSAFSASGQGKNFHSNGKNFVIEAMNLPRWGSAELAQQEANDLLEKKQLEKERLARLDQEFEVARPTSNSPTPETNDPALSSTTNSNQDHHSSHDDETKDGRVVCAPEEDPLMALFHAAQPSSTSSTAKNALASSSSSSSSSPSSKHNTKGPATGRMTINHRINRKICLWSGDLCRLSLDAVVNTTNERLDDTAGTSGRIFAASGPELRTEFTASFPEGCRTGSSIITGSYQLPCHRLIHTVGPRWNIKYKTAAENALHGCYRSSMQCLLEHGLATIAFPCVYTPRKKYPRKEAIHTCLRTVRRFLENFGDRIACVVFVVETEADRLSYVEHLPLYFPRTAEELARSHHVLPSNLGNEWGELILNERTIRIGSLPMLSGGGGGGGDGGGGGGGGGNGSGGNGGRSGNGGGNGGGGGGGRSHRYGSTLALDDDFVTMMDDMDKDRLAMLEEQRAGMPRRGGGEEGGHLDVDEVNELYQAYLMEAEETDLTDMMRLQCFYKPGVDHLDRPVFVICLKLLPPGTDMHRVMLYVIQKMDQVVEQDYVMVLVMSCSDSNNRPEFGWLQQMYSVFENKYKKNMKQLYVVHPSFWFKLAVWFMSPMLSASIWNKIVYVHEVRDLFHMFRPTQLLLPEFVYRYDREINAGSYETVKVKSQKEDL